MTDPRPSIPTLVVLGTGTHVGKTFVTQSLARTLNALGSPTLALKPIESGVPSRGLPARSTGGSDVQGGPSGGETPPPLREALSDAEILAQASAVVPEPLHWCALPEPISPHLAARRAGLTLDLSKAAGWVNDNALRYTTLRCILVESAGAVFSPLGEGLTNFDFAQRFPDALWLLVAPDALGVLHDVTACLTAMAARGRSPDFVVLSQARPPDASTGTNAAELERLGITRVAVVARRGEPDSLRPFAEELARRFAPA